MINRSFRSLSAPVRTLAQALGVAVFSLLSGSVLAEDLLEIYSRAADNDPTIRQARANYSSQHEMLSQGRALLMPSLNLNANTSRQTNGVAGNPGTGGGVFGAQPHHFANGFNSRGYNLSLSQNLLNMQAWYSYQSVRKSDRVAALNLARAEQELIVRVATAYFDVLRSQSALASYQAEEAASLQQLEQTQQRFDVGLIPITDVYTAQANADRSTVSRLTEENVLSQRFEALEAITGTPYMSVSELSDQFPIVPSDSSLDEWTSRTLEGNLTLQAAELDFEAKKDDARAARSAMLPTLSLNMGYNWNLSGNRFSFFGPNLANEGTQITLNFSLPLFAGGRNWSSMRQAYYTRDASEEALLKTRRDSTQSIRNSFRSVETDVRAVAAQAQSIVSAQSALEATQVGAEVGTRNVVDVVMAQSSLYQAQRAHSEARFKYVMDTLTLKQTAGVLTPQDVIDLNQWLVE
jgi:outer membrane protein